MGYIRGWHAAKLYTRSFLKISFKGSDLLCISEKRFSYPSAILQDSFMSRLTDGALFGTN